MNEVHTTVISTDNIAELKEIRSTPNALVVGGAVTLTQLELALKSVIEKGGCAWLHCMCSGSDRIFRGWKRSVVHGSC